MTSSLPLLTHPKVMISYSQDDDSYKEWVQWLADQLAASGINPIIDCYDLRAGISMTHFMEKAVADAYKILLILTPVYKTKADDRKGGVGYEHAMNSQELYKNQTAGKFIPIIRRGYLATIQPCKLPSRHSLRIESLPLFRSYTRFFPTKIQPRRSRT